MYSSHLIYLAVAIAAASQSGANAANIPSSNKFYYLPGSNKTAIVIYVRTRTFGILGEQGAGLMNTTTLTGIRIWY